ncbi:hypothetical protein E3C22_19925 [Jiella endophytica]|uniref:Phytase-like domain-containing protein n=1 Tax=Jiella endophytica TaxID=2558362 RepID=A0A4Y8RDM2_9HYPH|nr:esterase-like activity of phytase family protein [Jiella endophytica]TFF19927.1 hypothetical protein E3C22_19925 [Jiella endophytica]
MNPVASGRQKQTGHAAVARRAALAALLLVLGQPAGAASERQRGAAEPITIRAEEITRFRKGSETTRFGELSFLGGLQFSSFDSRLEGISAIRLDASGARFLAVTDKGSWLAGRISRDAAGRPTGFADATIAPLRDRLGRPIYGKALGDAESLAVDGNTAYVGFEQHHRIWAYDIDRLDSGRARNLPMPIPVQELRANKGLETLAIAPEASPVHGALVAVSEHSIDRDGNLFAGIVGERAGEGVFKVRRDAKWEVSDGDFLPDGDMLILERRFEGIFGGLGIRIRRIPAEDIRPGSLADGPVIFEADLADEIDNMEGLDVWQDDEGRTRLTLVSDDNGSIFQRNLLLEFVLEDGADRRTAVGQ